MEVLAPSAETLYILIEEDGVPQAVGTAVTYRTESPLINLLLRQCLFFIRPYAATTAFAIRPGVSARSAWQNIAKAVPELARKGFRPLCAIVLDEEALSLGDEIFGPLGYAFVDADPTTSMAVQWKTADEWLMSLGRKRRWNIRNSLKIAADAGVTVEVRAPNEVPHEELLRLLKETCAANGSSDLGGLSDDFMRKLESLVPGKHRILCAYHEGELVGFLWSISDGRRFRAPWAGLRYAVTRETGVYFALIHGAVRLAIEDGVEEFNFGLSNHTLKSRYGFDVRPRRVAVRLSFLPSSQALKPLMPLLQKQFGPREKPEVPVSE